MVGVIDIHEYGKKIEKKLVSCAEYFKTPNGLVLLDFIDYLRAKCYSEARILKYLDMLPRIDGIICKVNGVCSSILWRDVSKEQVIRYISFVECNKLWSAETKMCYRSVVKRFYKWLEGDDKEFPSKVSFIVSHVKKKDQRMIKPEECYTEEEKLKLVSSASNVRDRALVSLLAESGCRIGEALSMHVGCLKFDDFGCLATVEGKTGQRTVRLVVCTSDLALWLDNHPLKGVKDAPLFVNVGNVNTGDGLQYRNARKMLDNLFVKAGIVGKRTNPHMFRHSAASSYGGRGMFNEFQMNQFFGWVQGGKMASRYIHLNSKGTEDAMLSFYGLKTRDQVSDNSLKPRICPKCKGINSVRSSYCTRCGSVLDIETAMKLDDATKQETDARSETDIIMEQLRKDPAFTQMVMNKMKEMGIVNNVAR